MQIVILWTDALIYLLLIVLALTIRQFRRQAHLRNAWQQVTRKPLAVTAVVIMSFFLIIGVLDSIHYRARLAGTNNYATRLTSVFDKLIAPVGQVFEKSYSAPMATTLFVKQTQITDAGAPQRIYPALQHISAAVQGDGLWATLAMPLALLTLGFLVCLVFTLRLHNSESFHYRAFYTTLVCLAYVLIVVSFLASHVHVFGTDKIGQDVLYQTLKSIRTGLIIGTLTTLVMLPFAILLGIAAGYFGGRVDDCIQYLYTTLSSIPAVLLIAASVLSLQIFISNHSEWFATLAHRADARLLALCIILGVTSWTGLCRLLRAETLKLREIDYIQAARALATPHWKIITKHILPNVMHIVIIAVVLDFSTLVLAEAVLSYVGVGVDPSSISWGNMINSARLELAREPIVWWPLVAAFMLMFSLVLAANLLSDALRDGFDPRLRQ